jgi:hypothetical protein
MAEWTKAEKKIARQAFDKALQAELAEVVVTCKQEAAAARTADDVWALERHLGKARQAIDRRYDWRESQLFLVLGSLLAEGRLQLADFAGLSEEKIGRLNFFLKGL